MPDAPVWIVKIIEIYPSMSEEGIGIGEKQRLAFRVAGSQQEIEEKAAYPVYSAWLKANPGKAAQLSVSMWQPYNDKW